MKTIFFKNMSAWVGGGELCAGTMGKRRMNMGKVDDTNSGGQMTDGNRKRGGGGGG
jgi:hypothetical protein